MTKLITFAVIFLFSLDLVGASVSDDLNDLYDLWDSIVHKYVHPDSHMEHIIVSRVDYFGIKRDPNFPKFLTALAEIDATNLTKNETYALYMNAYSALAIDWIVRKPCLDGKPIRSIKNISDVNNVTVWDQFAGVVGGKKYTLNEIEGYLRAPAPWVEDSRVHGCIVCASISCPNVRIRAYRHEGIDLQMEENVRDWLTNPTKGSYLDKTNMTLTVSKIFFWFAGDFISYSGSVIDFIARFQIPEERKFLLENKLKITLAYWDYDWHVNGILPDSLCQ